MTYLKQVRIRAGKTQKQVAEDCGLSLSQYQKLEQQKRSTAQIALITALRMKESIGCDLYHLAGDGTISATSPY